MTKETTTGTKSTEAQPRHLRKRDNRRPIEETGPLIYPEHKKDSNYEYRWINVKDWNFELKLQHDWVPVMESGSELPEDKLKLEPSKMGSVVKKSVGGNIDAILCRKPKTWYEEDQADKRRVNNDKATEKSEGSHRYDKQIDITYSGDIEKG